MKNLEETVDLMLSNDPKDQLKAEYWQTKIRLDRLTEEIAIYDAGITPFDLPSFSREELCLQRVRMDHYLDSLRERAKNEDVDITDHEPEVEVKVGTKVRLKRNLNAANGMLPRGTVAIIALEEDDELMLFFPDYLVNSDTKLLRIYRSEIGGNDYEVMTDAQ